MEKSLGEFLKEKGLDVAEDTARSVVEAVFDFAEYYVKSTPNTTDDALAAGLLPLVKPIVLNAVDKIDKKEG